MILWKMFALDMLYGIHVVFHYYALRFLDQKLGKHVFKYEYTEEKKNNIADESV